MRLFLISAALMMICTGNVFASYHPPIDLNRLDGAEYLYLCEVGLDDEDIVEPFSNALWRLHECERFILELRHTLSKTSVHGYDTCIPENVTNIELVYLGVLWLNEYPGETEKTADEIVSAAINREFPCSPRGQVPGMSRVPE